MRAAVLEALEKLVVKEVPTPKAAPGTLLVRVKACAVCGSDIRIFHYGNPRVKPPQIIGHEIAGVVEAVGEGVENFRVGQRVATGADVPCGVCEYCKRGLANNCQTNFALGYQFPGGFAEYVLFNETTVKYGPIHEIPPQLDFDQATLAEPLACVINGMELADFKVGETLVIIGGGPAGCLLVEYGRFAGADKIILAQRSRGRLEMARTFSADVFVSTEEENLVKRVLEETDGRGADVVFTACSSPDAQALTPYLVRNRGRINFFGGLPKGSPKVPIDTNVLHYKEAFIFGSHGCAPRHHELALRVLASGRINMKDLISAAFPLAEIREAFQFLEDRKGLKVIVHP